MKKMKKTINCLFAAAALMIISMTAMAQNGTNPYAGSTHTYTVTPEDAINNTLTWSISGGGIINGATNGTSLSVTWGSTTGAQTITFTEYDPNTSCSTQRTLDVTVISNTFYLTMGADNEECHDLSGTVLAEGASGNTTVYFDVNLNKDSGWDIDSWKYDFSVAITNTNYSLQSVKVDGGADLGASGTYSNQTVLGTSGTSQIEVVLNGPVTEGTPVTVNLSSGVAIKGTTTTPDNGTGDKTQEITINPLPDTSEITTD